MIANCNIMNVNVQMWVLTENNITSRNILIKRILYPTLYFSMSIAGPISKATTVPPLDASAKFSEVSPTKLHLLFILNELYQHTIISSNVHNIAWNQIEHG